MNQVRQSTNVNIVYNIILNVIEDVIHENHHHVYLPLTNDNINVINVNNIYGSHKNDTFLKAYSFIDTFSCLLVDFYLIQKTYVNFRKTFYL